MHESSRGKGCSPLRTAAGFPTAAEIKQSQIHELHQPCYRADKNLLSYANDHHSIANLRGAALDRRAVHQSAPDLAYETMVKEVATALTSLGQCPCKNTASLHKTEST